MVWRLAASVHTSDFKGLRKLSEACGASFRSGIVLYDGEKSVPFGDRMVAAPISSLWS